MVLFSVSKLAAVFDPFNDPPWDELQGQTISKEEVLALLAAANDQDNPKKLIRAKKYSFLHPETKEQHINRIAGYAKRGWGSSTITLNFAYYPGWIITDGCHRFAASIVRGDEFICGNWEGSIEKARLFFYE